MTNLRFDCLPGTQVKLYNLLKNYEWIKDYYLAGGTGLALQLGHRESGDFDFFSDNEINTVKLETLINETGTFRKTYEEQDTLYGELNGIRVSFIKYAYPLIQDKIEDSNLSVAGTKDIAAMKLSAIVSRGTKKDFIDLFFLLKSFSLREMLEFYDKKFRSTGYHYTILRALQYFDEADQDPMPKMIENVNWTGIKETISSEIKKIDLI